MNQYEVLKVSRDAPQDVVTTAYHSLEKIYHTDVNSGSGDGTRTLQRINAAYEVLRDPKLRGQYDETLRTGEEIDPRLTKEPDGETHIPPHIHETIERELSNGLLPESAIAQLADTGYFIDAAAAAVVDVQQKLQNRFTAVRFVKSNRFWILLSGFLLMSGCGSPDPPRCIPPWGIVPPGIVRGPQCHPGRLVLKSALRA